MDLHQRTLRIGLTVILLAAVFRLWSAPIQIPSETPPVETTYIEQETGQSVRFPASLGSYTPQFVESPPPAADIEELPLFSDISGTAVHNLAKVRPDLDALIRQPLQWDLSQGGPAVLILHSHTTESYTPKGESYRQTAAYRTLEEDYNMLSIGDAVTEILVSHGISVIHDRTVHDYPSYNGAYSHARKTTQAYLKQYPGIRLVLDLHRDAAEGSSGQLRTLAEEEGCAQLMIVIGTNHKGFEDNLSLGLKLQSQLEGQSPGITRPLQLRAQRFNQDLLPGMLLVEVGAAGNTRQEALTAARHLAQAVVALELGTGEPMVDS